MATPRKLKSGNWTVQLHYTDPVSGEVIRPTFTAPTKAEVLYWIADYEKRNQDKRLPVAKLTVKDVVKRYIDLSRPTLSPTTIEAYERYAEHAFPDLMKQNAWGITKIDAQKAINSEVHRQGQYGLISPKTVKNEWSLVAAAMKKICDTTFNVSLPRIQERTPELPEAEGVIRAVIGTEIELPCLLSIWLSFSMSEIRGIKCSSIRHGKVYIERSVVTVHNQAVEKRNAKTQARIRSAEVPLGLWPFIQKAESWQKYLQGQDGYLVPQNRKWIYRRWMKICKENGFNLSFHGLRHLCASIHLNLLNTPRKTVQEIGGWTSDRVMSRNYEQEFTSTRKKADHAMNEFMESVIK